MRRSKYNAKPTVVDGIRFASKAEGRRYAQLKLMEGLGRISTLLLQKSFVLYGFNGGTVGTYRADFVYFNENGVRVIEDVKGVKTPVYRLKKRLMAAQGYLITEIKA